MVTGNAFAVNRYSYRSGFAHSLQSRALISNNLGTLQNRETIKVRGSASQSTPPTFAYTFTLPPVPANLSPGDFIYNKLDIKLQDRTGKGQFNFHRINLFNNSTGARVRSGGQGSLNSETETFRQTFNFIRSGSYTLKFSAQGVNQVKYRLTLKLNQLGVGGTGPVYSTP